MPVPTMLVLMNELIRLRDDLEIVNIFLSIPVNSIFSETNIFSLLLVWTKLLSFVLNFSRAALQNLPKHKI